MCILEQPVAPEALDVAVGLLIVSEEEEADSRHTEREERTCDGPPQ